MTSVSRPAAALRAPTTRRIQPADIVGFLGAQLVIIVAMWVRHGGLDQLTSIAGLAIAIGQLTALIGTYFALLQLLLMSRAPWLDRTFGRDRLAVAHRWLGVGTVWLLIGHAVFTTLGFALADGQTVLDEAWLLVTTWEFVLMATVSLGLFLAVAVSSMRLARRKLSYESWHGIHLYAYLAIALGFAHQLVVGTDFIDDPIARGYWIGLYISTIGTLVAFRFGAPLVINARHRFRVAAVVDEGGDVVSVYLEGRNLERFPIRAGQYVIVRFATNGWWRAHPYSISAQPNGRWLRLTVKALGDDSARLRDLAIGTRAYIEGPYGNLTTVDQRAQRTLLVAGGIGVTPLRAILEERAGTGPVTLLYRVRDRADLVFKRELDAIAERTGARIHYLVGARRAGDHAGPLGPTTIAWLVPDVAASEVYLCGPNGMMATAAASLHALGVPPERIHQERFFD